MYDQSTRLKVWELTKPLFGKDADYYWRMLNKVFDTPEQERFKEPFQVTKKSGGNRQIVPADLSLGYVQHTISVWMRRRFAFTNDYCYRPGGVKGAIIPHQDAHGAVVLDLKNAYDQVTEQKIVKQFRLQLYEVSEKAINALVSLLTYKGKAPQGCGTTPFVYNVVMGPIDEGLKLLQTGNNDLGIVAVTRYVDNICVSLSLQGGRKNDVIPKERLIWALKQIRSIIEGNGFMLSWTKSYDKPPFAFLGTLIYPDRFELEQDKYVEFCGRILQATESEDPSVYEKQINGTLTWAKYIAGEDMPLELIELFASYYRKIGRMPEGLVNVWSSKLTYKLPGV